MPKTLEQARELDRRYKGAEYDYDEKLTVKYFIDKHTFTNAVLDITNKRVLIGQAVVMQFKH